MGRTEPHVPKTKSKVQQQTKYPEKRSEGLTPTLGEGAASEPKDFTWFCHFGSERSESWVPWNHMAASMFNSGLRVVASKYDDKLLSWENLLCFVSSHVGILPGGAGTTRVLLKNPKPKNPASGEYGVNERANIRLLYEFVVYSVTPLWDAAAQMEFTVGLV